jgi:hypothetical protein
MSSSLNVQNGSMHFGITLPSMTVRGKYKIGGRVFELPIEGQGNYVTFFSKYQSKLFFIIQN